MKYRNKVKTRNKQWETKNNVSFFRRQRAKSIIKIMINIVLKSIFLILIYENNLKI
jgi:hypothetical protein